jgi:hypothetical protein
MKIPEVREELHKIAKDFSIPRLHQLADELVRRSTVRRARPQSVRVTDELESSIRAFAKRQPQLSFVEIARYFNVNPGRVSEAIAGRRT